MDRRNSVLLQLRVMDGDVSCLHEFDASTRPNAVALCLFPKAEGPQRHVLGTCTSGVAESCDYATAYD